MLFNSLHFIAFFVVFLFAYSLFSSWLYRATLILVASLYFYGSWKFEYLLLLLFTSLLDFAIALLISSQRERYRKKIFLALSIISNLAVLFVFKYLDFFIETFNLLSQKIGSNVGVEPYNLILPIGISFYTFQAMSYTIDVYRGELKPAKDPLLFLLYISFFPQLVAGPIERAGHLFNEFRKGFTLTKVGLIRGLQTMTFGFFMKCVLADNLSKIVEPIYADPMSYKPLASFLGTLAFSFQIYFDFWGYSTIALGLGQIMGLQFVVNFRRPYFATNIDAFWRRWHISLTTWFKDYLYITLGGNRISKWRTRLNIFLVFVISGLWHGASFNFVIWGAAHGACLFIYKTVLINKFRLPKFVTIFLTFNLASFLWIFFRAKDLPAALVIGERFWAGYAEFVYHFVNLRFYKILDSVSGAPTKPLAVSVVFLLILYCCYEYLEEFKEALARTVRQSPLTYLVMIFLIILFGNFTSQQFIYFQF